jgi:P2 family phage contractile tail tube protein
MKLPSKLKNFDLFQNGESWLGQVPSVTLPKLTRKMEDYVAGGMAGPVEIDLGQEKLELAFTAGGLLKSALDQYGATAVDAVGLRFAGAYQSDSTSGYSAVEVAVRGCYKEFDPGDAKTQNDTEHKFTVPCSYYRLSIDGVPVIEIDMLANKVVVNGVDRTAAQRAAIGHW